MPKTKAARTRNVPTWKMSKQELARTWAAHFGYAGRAGGWIYSPTGRAVAHGWDDFADLLALRGFIVPGTGIDWRTSGENPRVTR